MLFLSGAEPTESPGSFGSASFLSCRAFYSPVEELQSALQCFSYLCILLPLISVFSRGLINIQGRVMLA